MEPAIRTRRKLIIASWPCLRIETKGKVSNLDYRRIVYEPEIATTKHGIRTIRRIVANAALTRIQLVVNNGHLQERRISTDSQTEEDGLSGRQKKNEQEHPVKRRNVKTSNECGKPKNNQVLLPNVAERLHEILADERSAAMPRRNGQFKSAAAALADRPAAGRRASAAAARVSRITAGAAAARRA